MTQTPPASDATRGLGRIGYLGPDFTFSRRAALALAKGEVLIDFGGIDTALDQLDAGVFAAVVLPVETSAGYVLPALDALTRHSGPLAAVAQHSEPIRFGLYRRADDAAPLTEILSHLMSFKQCADWLDGHAPARRTVVASNGAAFLAVRDGGQSGVAAIAPAALCEPGMIEIAADLQGSQANETRFLRVQPGSPNALAAAALLLLDGPEAAETLRPVIAADGSALDGAPRRTSDGRWVLDAHFAAPVRLTALAGAPGVRVLLSTPAGLDATGDCEPA